jgi:hypothetical protein
MNITIIPNRKERDRIEAILFLSFGLSVCLFFIWLAVYFYQFDKWNVEHLKNQHAEYTAVTDCMKREYGLTHIIFNRWEDKDRNQVAVKNLGVCANVK